MTSVSTVSARHKGFANRRLRLPCTRSASPLFSRSLRSVRVRRQSVGQTIDSRIGGASWLRPIPAPIATGLRTAIHPQPANPRPLHPSSPGEYLRPLTNHSSRPCFARRLNSGVRPAMTPMHRFAVLVLIGISTSACSAQQSIPACPSGLQPLTSVPPILPAKLHNDFEGSVVISFVIDRDGRVQSPVVASSAWQPMGRTSPSKSGHNDVVLSAIQQWRYPSQPRPCRHQAPFEFKFDSSLTSLRGRSNNSFKPTLLRKAA